LFTVEMKSVGQLSGMALRDTTGKYLTAVARDGVIQARNRNIGKDELFVVEDSQPQVVFTAHNGKMASVKQGTLDSVVIDKTPFDKSYVGSCCSSIYIGLTTTAIHSRCRCVGTHANRRP